MARVGGLSLVRVPESQRILVHRLDAQVQARVHDLLPQGLSASAAAFAKLRHYTEELFDEFAVAAMKRFAAFLVGTLHTKVTLD